MSSRRSGRVLSAIVLVAVGVWAAPAALSAPRLRSDASGTTHVANKNPAPQTNSVVLYATHEYRIKASGTASDWCPPTAKQASDCTYGSPLAIGTGIDSLYCFAKWHGCTPAQLWRPLGVSVGDANGPWLGLDQIPGGPTTIPYEGSHVYTVEFVAKPAEHGKKLSFVGGDALQGSGGDNSGTFTVTMTDLGPKTPPKHHLALNEKDKSFTPYLTDLASGATVRVCNEDPYQTGVIFTKNTGTSLHLNPKTKAYEMPSVKAGDCKSFTVHNHTKAPLRINLFSEIHAKQKAVLVVEPA